MSLASRSRRERAASSLLRLESDERLVALARAGEAAAFEAIARRHRPLLVRVCVPIAGEAEAQDAVQEAMMEAWSALRRGTEVRSLRPWLCTIARREALRRIQPAAEALTDDLRAVEGTAEQVERDAELSTALTAIAALPDRARRALVRAELDGASRAQIAAELQTSEGAIRQLLFRARRSVRAAARVLVPVPLLLRLIQPAAEAGAGHVGAAKVAAVGLTTASLAAAPIVVHEDEPPAMVREVAAEMRQAEREIDAELRGAEHEIDAELRRANRDLGRDLAATEREIRQALADIGP